MADVICLEDNDIIPSVKHRWDFYVKVNLSLVIVGFWSNELIGVFNHATFAVRKIVG